MDRNVVVRQVGLPSASQTLPLLLAGCLLLGCAVPVERLASRATMIESAGWRLGESCVTRSCIPRIDELKGRDIAIKLIPEIDPGGGVFLLRVYFLADPAAQFTFDPSKVTTRLEDGREIPAKGVACPGWVRTLAYLRAAPRLMTPLPVSGVSCVLLFFDCFNSSPPAVTMMYSLQLGGLFRAGENVSIPELTFLPRYVVE